MRKPKARPYKIRRPIKTRRKPTDKKESFAQWLLKIAGKKQ
jgi:hypothetical protein